jgi:hypothetical protein
MISLARIFNQLHIFIVLLLCCLFLMDAAVSGICLCDFESPIADRCEQLVKDFAEPDTDLTIVQYQHHREQEHSDCQDQSCFCCASKLPVYFDLTLISNNQQIHFIEIYSCFVPDNSFPPLTPPPKAA